MKIYEPKGRAREYSPFALNYFSVCDHGCLYCYVPRIFARNTEYVHSNVSARDITKLDREAAKFAKSTNANQQILLSFTGDPYCQFENGETRKVIEILIKYGLHFNILTKNPVKAIRDIDLLTGYEFCKIGTTVTCIDNGLSKKWEPNAPLFAERMEALSTFSIAGIPTWISFEPVLFPKETLAAIRYLGFFGDRKSSLFREFDIVKDIKIGKLNNFKHPDLPNVDWRKFLYDAIAVADKIGTPYYIKKDLLAYEDENRPVSKTAMFVRFNQDVFNI